MSPSCNSRLVSYPGAVVYSGERIVLEHDYRWIVLLKDCDHFDLFKIKYNLCTSRFDIFRVSRSQMREMGVVLVINDHLSQRTFTLDAYRSEPWRLTPLRHSGKRDKNCGCGDVCVIEVQRSDLDAVPKDDPCCGSSKPCGC